MFKGFCLEALHIPVGPMPAGFVLLNEQCCLGFHSGLVDALFLVSYRWLRTWQRIPFSPFYIYIEFFVEVK